MDSRVRVGALDKRARERSQARELPEAGDVILAYLEQIGVEYVFGVPGGAIEPLYNALARSARRGGIRPIVARHESGAAFMADGYARETGRLGVCCATTGPGATNMITGVASAYQDHVPLLAITAQTSLHTFGYGAVQESSCTAINTVGMYQHCTHYNSLVSHAAQLERKLLSALMVARQSAGPVHLSIPLDVLRSRIAAAYPGPHPSGLPREQKSVDHGAVETLFEHVADSCRMIVVAGEGCDDAVAAVLEFAVLTGAIMVATPQGSGAVCSYHPNYRGVCGLAGHGSAQALLMDPEVDLVLAVGTRLDQQATQGWYESVEERGRLMHIDSTSRNFTRSPSAMLHVNGDPLTVFTDLNTRLKAGRRAGAREPWDVAARRARVESGVVRMERRAAERRRAEDATAARQTSTGARPGEQRLAERRAGAVQDAGFVRHFRLDDEAKYLSDAVPIKPQRVMYDLARLFPPNTRFLADIGSSFLWAIHYLHPLNLHGAGLTRRDRGVRRTSMGFASMGWAVGSAVGTALGNPRDPVVCIVGDGSYLMCGQEITTAVLEQLPVIFVVLNDQALGTVKHGQRLAKAEPVGFDLPPVDFAAVARAMGAQAYTIRSPQDMAALDVAALCGRRGPTLLDVRIDRDEAPPLGVRMSMLAS